MRSYLFTAAALAGLFIILSIAELFRHPRRMAIFHISSTIFGMFYIGGLASHSLLLLNLPLMVPIRESFTSAVGLPVKLDTSLVALQFVLTWISDTAAFFFGIALGRHLLAKDISPKKTVEGAIFGFIFAVIASVVYMYVYAPYLSILDAIALGVLVGIFAPVGDLFESMLKRDVGLKNSSELIPGHGGVLDRMDSLLFVMPVIYYYLRLVVFV